MQYHKSGYLTIANSFELSNLTGSNQTIEPAAGKPHFVTVDIIFFHIQQFNNQKIEYLGSPVIFLTKFLTNCYPVVDTKLSIQNTIQHF